MLAPLAQLCARPASAGWATKTYTETFTITENFAANLTWSVSSSYDSVGESGGELVWHHMYNEESTLNITYVAPEGYDGVVRLSFDYRYESYDYPSITIEVYADGAKVESTSVTPDTTFQTFTKALASPARRISILITQPDGYERYLHLDNFVLDLNYSVSGYWVHVEVRFEDGNLVPAPVNVTINGETWTLDENPKDFCFDHEVSVTSASIIYNGATRRGIIKAPDDVIFYVPKSPAYPYKLTVEDYTGEFANNPDAKLQILTMIGDELTVVDEFNFTGSATVWLTLGKSYAVKAVSPAEERLAGWLVADYDFEKTFVIGTLEGLSWKTLPSVPIRVNATYDGAQLWVSADADGYASRAEIIIRTEAEYVVITQSMNISAGDAIAPHLYDWHFDGQDDYVVLPDIDTPTAFTVQFRAYAQQDALAFLHFEMDWDSEGLATGWYLAIDADSVSFEVREGSSYTVAPIVYGGGWVEGYACHDNSTGMMKICVNGETAERTQYRGATATPRNDEIGSKWWGLDAAYLKGYVSYIMIRGGIHEEITYVASDVLRLLDPTFWDGTHYIDLVSGAVGTPYGGVERVLAENMWIWRVVGRYGDGYVHLEWFPVGSIIVFENATGRYAFLMNNTSEAVALSPGEYIVRAYIPAQALGTGGAVITQTLAFCMRSPAWSATFNIMNVTYVEIRFYDSAGNLVGLWRWMPEASAPRPPIWGEGEPFIVRILREQLPEGFAASAGSILVAAIVTVLILAAAAHNSAVMALAGVFVGAVAYALGWWEPPTMMLILLGIIVAIEVARRERS